eukprot:8069380-Pyramimonas_sp.AAC.1
MADERIGVCSHKRAERTVEFVGHLHRMKLTGPNRRTTPIDDRSDQAPPRQYLGPQDLAAHATFVTDRQNVPKTADAVLSSE